MPSRRLRCAASSLSSKGGLMRSHNVILASPSLGTLPVNHQQRLYTRQAGASSREASPSNNTSQHHHRPQNQTHLRPTSPRIRQQDRMSDTYANSKANYEREAALVAAAADGGIEGNDEKLKKASLLTTPLPRADGASWGAAATLRRHVHEDFIQQVVTNINGTNKAERLRILMRNDPRPWNILLRLDRRQTSLKDSECAKLLLWTAAIVSLEKHQGRKVHALQMGHEMFAIMQRGHRTGIETLMAFYRLCEVSRDLTTAFTHFSAFIEKNYPPVMGDADLADAGMRQASALGGGGGGGATASSSSDDIYRRRYTPDVLLHLAWLLRIASAQPNDDKCEEIAQIVRALYENQGFASFGALPQAPKSDAHRERLILTMAAEAASFSPTATTDPNSQNGSPLLPSPILSPANSVVVPQLQGQRKSSAFLGSISAALHCQHLEIFSLLQHLKPRVELVCRLDPEADATVLAWIDEYCEALGIISKNDRQPSSSSSSSAVAALQTGRWFVNPSVPSQQRLPQTAVLFPHLDGGLQMAANILSPVAESKGVASRSSSPTALVPTLAAMGGGAGDSASTASTHKHSSVLVLAPPSHDCPYIRDSLLRDDVIEQLEALAFSFTAEEGRKGSWMRSITDPILRNVVETQPANKRFSLLTELVSKIRKEISALGQDYGDWLEQTTGSRPNHDDADDELDGAAESQKMALAAQRLTRQRLEEKMAERIRKNGGSAPLTSKNYHKRTHLKALSVEKAPLPPPMGENSVWRLPHAPVANGKPLLFLAALEDAAMDVIEDGSSAFAVSDATRLIQLGVARQQHSADTTLSTRDGRTSQSTAAAATIARDQDLMLFASSVIAYGQLPAEIYHYLLVALSRYAPTSCVSLLKKLDDADVQILDVTRAAVLCGFARQAEREFDEALINKGKSKNSIIENSSSLAEAERPHTITSRVAVAFSDPNSSLATTVTLFKAQLEAMSYRDRVDRDNDVSNAVQAYWAYNYPLLLDHRNSFADRKSFYAFLLPAMGVNALLDLVLTSEIHRKVFDSEFADENGDNGSSSQMISEDALRDIRNNLPIIDTDLGCAIAEYLKGVVAHEYELVDRDVLVPHRSNLWQGDDGGAISVVDHVLNLVTTQLPKLDIGLVGSFPNFETYALPKPNNDSGPKTPKGHSSSDLTSDDIATSLLQLKQRIDSVHAHSASSQHLKRIQPLYVLDASFLENREHVSTLLSIISSHRRNSNKQANSNGPASSVISPPILLVPYSSLADLAETAKGAGRDIYLDATTILDTVGDGARSAEDSDNVVSELTVRNESKFDAPSSEMSAANDALMGVSRLIAKVPKNMMVLHFTEMCLAYHAKTALAEPLGGDGVKGQSLATIENNDTWLLRMASLLKTLGSDAASEKLAVLGKADGVGDAVNESVQYSVHLCTDDPAFVLRVKHDTTLRRLADGVHFLSTSPLVSGLLRDGDQHMVGSSRGQAGDSDAIEVEVTKPTFFEEETPTTRCVDDSATISKHKHASLWGEDCESVIASIPSFHDSKNEASETPDTPSNDFVFNLEDRPINPVSAEELEAEAKRNRAILEKMMKDDGLLGTEGHAKPKVDVVKPPVSDATDVGEFTADSWMDMLGDEDEVTTSSATDTSSAISAQPTTPESAQLNNDNADEDIFLDQLAAEGASSAVEPSSATSAALSKKDKPLMPVPALSRKQKEKYFAAMEVHGQDSTAAPQDELFFQTSDGKGRVKLLGDVSVLESDIDDILSELISSSDAEAAELAKAFLRRREESRLLRSEMTVNDGLSSSVEAIQGPDHGAVFYGQFESTRSVADSELLTVEQQNHLTLQKAFQNGGTKALKKALRRIQSASLSSQDVNSKGGGSTAGHHHISDFIGGGNAGGGKGSGVAFTEEEERRMKQEEMRRMQKQFSEKWSNRAIVQDHLANQTATNSVRARIKDGFSKALQNAVDTDSYRVYEVNVNDPRNAHIVDQYKYHQRHLVERKARKATAREFNKKHQPANLDNERDGL